MKIFDGTTYEEKEVVESIRDMITFDSSAEQESFIEEFVKLVTAKVFFKQHLN